MKRTSIWRDGFGRGLHVVVFVVGLLLLGMPPQLQAQQWIAAWGSSHQGLTPEDETVSDATVRMIARSTIAGDRLRVRLENTFGDTPLRIAAASVALRNTGPAIVPGTITFLTFGGDRSVSIPAGGRVMSDPVALGVPAGQDIAVSLHVPMRERRASVHSNARTTSYLTANQGGDQTADVDGTVFTQTTGRMYWLSAIEVETTVADGAIVAFGDSITDGSCATTDGHDRWEDIVYRRLRESTDGVARFAMINAGIGGNTVTHEGLVPPPDSPPAIERMERDVLELDGITHLVLFIGTNDIRRGASAEQVISGLQRVVARAKDHGLVVVAATIIPRHREPRAGSRLGFDAAKNAIREAVNAWIRGTTSLDGVIDFDAVVRVPDRPDRIRPLYDCDGIHPNVSGYQAMGRSVDLGLFLTP